MQELEQTILDAGVLIHGHFIFADGNHATTKLEMDNLWDNPRQLSTILDNLAEAVDLPPADLILGVPSGGQRLASELVATGRIRAPFIALERVPGGDKRDYRFVTPAHEALVRQAGSIRIYEDVVTTLSSIAGVMKLLDPSRQDIHALAIWRRGKVKVSYRKGVTDHYLIERIIPSYAPDDCPVCSLRP